MGPRALARGNFAAGRLSVAGGRLQWGRGLSPAEICAPVRGNACVMSASMGPRALARGNRNESRDPHGKSFASMGPRALARGNQVLCNDKRWQGLASMGPRALARGNG